MCIRDRNGFEKNIADYTGSNFAIATVNGTSALHISMILSGVEPGDEVLTQALTFIATCNAISYSGASPTFIDIDIDTLGMSPKSLKSFLAKYAVKKGKHTFNKLSGKRIGACIPMHTFGFPVRIEEICDVCEDWNIPLIEDAAESLGTFSNKKHTGTFGQMGTLSFNGNKVITTGGGGMIIGGGRGTFNDDSCFSTGHSTTEYSTMSGKSEKCTMVSAKMFLFSFSLYAEMLRDFYFLLCFTFE